MSSTLKTLAGEFWSVLTVGIDELKEESQHEVPAGDQNMHVHKHDHAFGAFYRTESRVQAAEAASRRSCRDVIKSW